MSTTQIEIISTVLFFLAIIHTFLVTKIEMIAHRFNRESIQFKIIHPLSDVELVFAFWAIIFLLFFIFTQGISSTLAFATKLNFTEPLFVFVILCMAATRGVITLAENVIHGISSLLPLPTRMSFYVTSLIVGPLLGSLITEPAAMAMTSLILLDVLYKEPISKRLKYATLALLFVNVSIGGTLTHFAAPPVLMVSEKWQWDTLFMLIHFGYKSVIAIVISTSLYVFLFRKELRSELTVHKKKGRYFLIHLLFLAGIILTSHQPKIFVGIFVLFLIFMKITKEHQDPLKIKESVMVGVFLGGLVVLGALQSWWLGPLLSSMNHFILFLGATALTGITDNAALTYLGSLVDLSESSKYALVAGAVAGGGLTVIANAPNPIAYGILKENFGEEGINPITLFLWALTPTLIAMISFWFLP